MATCKVTGRPRYMGEVISCKKKCCFTACVDRYTPRYIHGLKTTIFVDRYIPGTYPSKFVVLFHIYIYTPVHTFDFL